DTGAAVSTPAIDTILLASQPVWPSAGSRRPPARTAPRRRPPPAPRLPAAGGELAAGGVDVAAAGEADGGGEAVLGEDGAEALDPLRRRAVVGAGRVVGDQVDLVAARVEQL